MDDRIVKLYKNLLNSGFTENDLGTQDKFNELLSDSASNKRFYDNLMAADKFTESDLGSYEQFSAYTLNTKKKESGLVDGTKDQGTPKHEDTDLLISPRKEADISLKILFGELQEPSVVPQDATQPAQKIEALSTPDIPPTEPPVPEMDIVKSTPVMTTEEYLKSREVLEKEAGAPEIQDIVGKGELTLLDVEKADEAINDFRVGDAVAKGELEKVPVLKKMVEDYPFLHPMIDFTRSLAQGSSNMVYGTLGSAQKTFYKTIGKAMQMHPDAGIKARGMSLEAQQEVGQNWFEYVNSEINKGFDDAFPEVQRNNFFASSVAFVGETIPLLASLSLTPAAAIKGVSLKFPLQLGTIHGFEEAAETGELKDLAKGAIAGTTDGLILSMLGYTGKGISEKVVNNLTGKVKPQSLSMLGASTQASTVASGGFAYDVGHQLASGVPADKIDWGQAATTAGQFAILETQGLMNAAAFAYTKMPKDVVRFARGLEVDAERLRESAIQLERESFVEKDVMVKAEKLAASASMHRFADLKAIDKLAGERPEVFDKMMKEANLTDKEKADLSLKVDEARMKQQMESQLPVEAPKKPVEDVSPESKGKVLPEKDGPSERPGQAREPKYRPDEMMRFEDTSELSGLKKTTQQVIDFLEKDVPSLLEKSEGGVPLKKEGVFNITNVRNLIGETEVKSVEQAKAFAETLKKSIENIDVEMAKRKEMPQRQEGEIEYGGNRYNDVDALKKDLRSVDNLDRLPLSMDIDVMRALDAVKKEREQQSKTKEDAVQKQSTEKMDVGEQAKDGKKVGERDAQKQEAPKEKELTEKDRYMAETVQEGASISSAEFGKKTSRLQQKIEDKKADDATKRWAVDSFLKAHKAKIDAAGLSSGEARQLSKATTWKQVRNAMGRVQKKIEQQDPKMRAAAMEDFIRNKKGKLGGLTSRATEALAKRINRAAESDAKLKAAEEYLEQLVTKKGARETLEAKAKLESDIDNLTSSKKILEKKGKRPIVKRTLKTKEGEITDRLMEINDLFNTGKSKKTPDVQKEREALSAELDRLARSETLSEAEARREVEVRDRLLELDVANKEMLSVNQLTQIKDYIKGLRDEGRSRAMAELDKKIEQRKALTAEMNKAILGDKVVPRTFSMDQARKSTDPTFMWLDASWQSGLAKIASKGVGAESGRAFSDPLNQALTVKYVQPAETKMQTFDVRIAQERDAALKDVFGSTAKGAKAMINAVDNKITITLNEGNGRSVTEVINERQALEKWLQKRDLELYEDMVRPLSEKGNGFTEETFDQIEKALSPEMKKFGEWMYDNLGKWARAEYNPAYKRMNGIDMANFDNPYWPSAKSRSTTSAEGVFEAPTIQPGLLQNRTIRRTGVKAPLEYTDAINTYMGYVKEAARYNAWAEPHKEISYILRNPEVRKAIAYTQGKRGNQHVDYFLSRFAGKSERQTLDVLDYMTNSLGSGILGFKPMVGIKQTFSSAYYLMDMPGTALTNGTVRAMSKGTTEYEVSKWLETDPFVLARRDAFLQRDVAASDKYYGYLEGNNKARSAAIKLLAKAKVDYNANTQGLKKAQNSFIRVGDKTPITKAGAAYLTHKYQQYSGKKLTKDVLANHVSGKKINANLTKAKEDWLMQASMTQQSVRESNVSRFRASGSLQRALTQFTSGPAQIWRVETDAIRNFKKAQRARDKASMLRAIKNFMLTHALSGLIFGLANVKFQIKGNEKELLLSVLKGNLEGIALIGRVGGYVYNKLLRKPWADESLMSFPAADIVIKTGEAAEYLIVEQKKAEPRQDVMEDNAKKILENILTLNGLGVTGVENIYEGYGRLIEGKSNYPVLDALGIGEPYQPEQTKGLINE